MREFFYPQSVAVMGVSASEDNLAKNAVQNMLEMGFDKPIYPIGRGGGTIFGLTVYRSIEEVPGHVDLVNIVTPARTLPEILGQWGERGTRAAVLITAGFTEYGEERRDLEEEVLAVARRYGIRLVGPNCQGIINTDNGLCLPFIPFNRGIIKKGCVAVISQSGSVAGMLTYLLSDEPLGLSKFLSIGNKLDLKEVDLLPLLYEDEQTEIICLYMEGIDRGRDLLEVARRSPKPILAYKSNVTEAASRIARSHTAALASDSAVTMAALRQANVVRVDRLSKFISYAKAFTLQPMKGNNLAVLSTFGGQAVISADTASQCGFNLPPFPESVLDVITQSQRAKVTRIGNPMDLGDVFETEANQAAAEAVINLPEIDGMVMILPYAPNAAYGMVTTKPMLRDMRQLSAKLGKPVAFSLMSLPSLLRKLRDEEELPYFPTPEEAVEALAASRDYWRYKNLPPEATPGINADREKVETLLAGMIGKLPVANAFGVLQAYGIPSAPAFVCHSADQAADAARRTGYPVAMKIESAHVSHKSDVGGVAIGLRDEQSVRAAFESIMNAVAQSLPQAKLEGVVVQPVVTGREVILGGRQDENFGPVVMFGLGGIHVEVLKDVAFRVAPVSGRESRQMIREIRALPVLEGIRGQSPADTDFLADCLVRLGHLLADFPQIQEIDVNPMIVFNEGQRGLAVDARMIVSGAAEP